MPRGASRMSALACHVACARGSVRARLTGGGEVEPRCRGDGIRGRLHGVGGAIVRGGERVAKQKGSGSACVCAGAGARGLSGVGARAATKKREMERLSEV
eukprot:6146132-Pleurochrysis_carterae.AAC.1